MVPHNMTWMKYPSQSQHPFINVRDIISSQHIISRLMHGYIALLVPTGLLAGIIILGTFLKNCKQRTLDKLDTMIVALTCSNILIIFLSLTISTRPSYLKVSYLECGALSFFFNWGYFNSQYLLVLMMLSFLLKGYPPQNAVISRVHQKPMVCVGVVLTCAFCAATTVVALLGIVNYHEETDCQLDPLFAWPEYEIIKFTLGFCIPSVANLLCFILSFVKKGQSESSITRQTIHPYWTVLVIAVTMFASRLFYNVMILARTNLKIQGSIGTPQNELNMNIAEIMLFSESCISLGIVLGLHKPCRTGLLHCITNLTKVCRRRDASNRTPEIQGSHTEVSFAQPNNGSH
ncbi:uncharacterized protein LOC123024941 [Varanus komodoensis]|nr:uncharacterized protein LOC123024941 [Varanus komodoensis]XP_044289154.1 uncharacterized protein LOC123024941 [Varanus komodoensis]